MVTPVFETKLNFSMNKIAILASTLLVTTILVFFQNAIALDKEAKLQPDNTPPPNNSTEPLAPVGIASNSVSNPAMMKPGKIRVIKLSGAKVKCIGKGGISELKQGQFISQGTVIITGPEASVELAFENGSSIIVKPGSEFSIDRFLQEPFDQKDIDYSSIENEPTMSVTQTRLKTGEIFFHVSKLKQKSSYQIATPLGIAGIRGTGGFVQYGKGKGAFGLYEGSADFRTPNGQVHAVTQDQAISIGGPQLRYAASQNTSEFAELLMAAKEKFSEMQRQIPPQPFENKPLPEKKVEINQNDSSNNTQIASWEYDMLISLNPDKNGIVSLENFVKRDSDVFDIRDSNGDEKLSPEEEKLAEEEFSIIDANKNGFIEKEEKINYSPWRFYKMFDFNMDGLVDISSFLSDSYKVVSPIKEDKNFEIENTAQGIVIKKYIGKSPKVTIPEKIQGIQVYAIGKAAFVKRNDIVEVKLPSTLKEIQEGAFCNCSSLLKIDLPKGLEKIGYVALQGLISKKSINIPSSVKVIQDSFGGSFEEINVDPDNPDYSSKDGVLYNKAQDILIYIPARYKKNKFVVPKTVKRIFASAIPEKLTEIRIPKETLVSPDCPASALEKIKRY